MTDRRGIDLSRPVPVAAQPRSDGRIHHAIRPAVQDVFQVLLRQDVRWVARLPVVGVDPGWGWIEVRGTVEFVGDINGQADRCPGVAGTQDAVGEILGMSTAEVVWAGPTVLQDAIREVTNRTVGECKNALRHPASACKLTLPTIVRSDGPKVGAIKGAARSVVRFECSGHPLVAAIEIRLA